MAQTDNKTRESIIKIESCMESMKKEQTRMGSILEKHYVTRHELANIVREISEVKYATKENLEDERKRIDMLYKMLYGVAFAVLMVLIYNVLTLIGLQT